MSTAGKVLSVLVALLTAAWVLLAAGVTQLNRNGASAVEKLQAQVAQTQTSITKAKQDIARLTDAAFVTRHENQNALAGLQLRQTEVEKKRSAVSEMLSRVKFQTESVVATVEAAKAGSQQRKVEFEGETKAKSEAEALVETLKKQNSESRASLASLQDKFKAALENGRSRVGTARKGAGERSPAASRSGSGSGSPATTGN